MDTHENEIEPSEEPTLFPNLSTDDKLNVLYSMLTETNTAMRGTQELVQGVVAEVGPMVESFANNPMLKTLGFGKKFGK